MRLWLAVQCFFKVLFDGEFSRQVRQLPAGETAPPQSEVESDKTLPAKKQSAPPPKRSDAITLLATLQREARFVDIVCEPLDGYSDAQIGAAARDVLRDSGKVLDRLFSLQPVVDAAEGNRIDVPASYETGKYRLTGNVSGDPPFSGELTHSGWEATTVQLPAWSGSEQAALVIAPAEVQIS